MGVRLYMYLVDLSRFDALLELSLANLLIRHVRDCQSPSECLTVTFDFQRATFVAAPGGFVSCAITPDSTRQYSVLTENQLQTTPILHKSVREYLSTSSTYQLNWLLGAFCNWPSIDCVQQLIPGHRRWWIGSFLQSAFAALSHNEYEQLVCLFQKLLRGYDCGYPIPDGDIAFSIDQFPFAFKDDSDFHFGRWTAPEAITAASLLSHVADLTPLFRPPPQPIGIVPDEADWHQWVHKNVTSLLSIAKAGYDSPNVLSFIG